MNKDTLEYLGDKVDQARRIDTLIKYLEADIERLEKMTPDKTHLIIESRDKTPQSSRNLVQVRMGDIEKENFYNKISCKVRDATIEIIKAQIEELQLEFEAL
jgi:hypothetical protein